jgi:hypothetical protein
MTTRALVPNADGEGSLGIEGLNWGAMYVSSPEKDDDSQKVPSTAWVRQIIAEEIQKASLFTLERIFPVGSIYTSLTDSRNPSEILGFGTWEPLPAGYTLIAQGQGTDQFGSFEYVAGQKYGERMHQLTAEEMVDMSLPVWSDKYGEENGILGEVNIDGGPNRGIAFPQPTTGDYRGYTFKVHIHGGNQPWINLGPSVACHAWRRQQ